jgi:hypothetical protein
MDVGLGLMGPFMATLAAEARELNALLPEEERVQSTTLNAKAAWLSQDLEDRPVLVFELASGSLLPLAMQSGDFAGLTDEIALLGARPKGPSH